MRYAIYFTPTPDTALWRLGSSILGYDAEARQSTAYPQHGLWHETWFVRAQETPARYGFHATLKAPFALAPGVTEGELLGRAFAFSNYWAPIYLPAMEVVSLDAFVALCPLVEDAELNRLAAACVSEFDDLRAPLDPADRERRLSQVLTQRQHEHLDRWGYPHVFDDYRFHMTLTGPIPRALQPRALEVLRSLYRRISAPVRIDAITVLAQATRRSRFVILERFQLRAEAPAIGLGR
jgi:putative phosphonate metabolism protein